MVKAKCCLFAELVAVLRGILLELLECLGEVGRPIISGDKIQPIRGCRMGDRIE